MGRYDEEGYIRVSEGTIGRVKGERRRWRMLPVDCWQDVIEDITNAVGSG